jgi:hypothetical protein
MNQIGTCHKSRKYLRCPFAQRYRRIPLWFPIRQYPSFYSTPEPPIRQIDIVVAPVLTPLEPSPVSQPPANSNSLLQLNTSPLQPHCHAEEHIFLWRGPNMPPSSTINDPTIQLIAALASHASLRDTASYGSGLRKYHLFCDIFTIPEPNHLPASFPLLHSFALWAASDPSMLNSDVAESIPFEPISVSVVRNYLAAVRAWHITQGWPPPLSDDDHDRINWSLCGLKNIQRNRKHPLCPPITIDML